MRLLLALLVLVCALAYPANAFFARAGMRDWTQLSDEQLKEVSAKLAAAVNDPAIVDDGLDAVPLLSQDGALGNGGQHRRHRGNKDGKQDSSSSEGANLRVPAFKGMLTVTGFSPADAMAINRAVRTAGVSAHLIPMSRTGEAIRFVAKDAAAARAFITTAFATVDRAAAAEIGTLSLARADAVPSEEAIAAAYAAAPADGPTAAGISAAAATDAATGASAPEGSPAAARFAQQRQQRRQFEQRRLQSEERRRAYEKANPEAAQRNAQARAAARENALKKREEIRAAPREGKRLFQKGAAAPEARSAAAEVDGKATARPAGSFPHFEMLKERAAKAQAAAAARRETAKANKQQ